MSNTHDLEVDTRLDRIEWEIKLLKQNSLLHIRMWLGAVSIFLAETIIFDLLHSAKGL
jgi:hypothetical protein